MIFSLRPGLHPRGVDHRFLWSARLRSSLSTVLVRFLGLRCIVLYSPVEWHDRFPVNQDRFTLLGAISGEVFAQ
jgi:hypothetical protein